MFIVISHADEEELRKTGIEKIHDLVCINVFVLLTACKQVDASNTFTNTGTAKEGFQDWTNSDESGRPPV